MSKYPETAIIYFPLGQVPAGTLVAHVKGQLAEHVLQLGEQLQRLAGDVTSKDRVAELSQKLQRLEMVRFNVTVLKVPTSIPDFYCMCHMKIW